MGVPSPLADQTQRKERQHASLISIADKGQVRLNTGSDSRSGLNSQPQID